jgi:hypothetical protein
MLCILEAASASHMWIAKDVYKLALHRRVKGGRGATGVLQSTKKKKMKICKEYLK